MSVDQEFRLTEGTNVLLALGDGGERIPGEILAFFGAVVLFTPHAALTQRAVEQLTDGATAYLLAQEGAKARALRGVLIPAGDMLALKLTDSFRLGQRRQWSRADVALSARLVPQGGGPPPTESTTVDLSPTGVRVHRPAEMLVWPRYEIALSGEVLDGPVVIEATPTRVHADTLSLRFTTVEQADRQVLTAVVANHLSRRG